MARAYAELFTPRPFDLTTFPNDEGYDELVLARRIPVRSVCEHHLLPFVGTAHVGYLPGARLQHHDLHPPRPAALRRPLPQRIPRADGSGLLTTVGPPEPARCAR